MYKLLIIGTIYFGLGKNLHFSFVNGIKIDDPNWEYPPHFIFPGNINDTNNKTNLNLEYDDAPHLITNYIDGINNKNSTNLEDSSLYLLIHHIKEKEEYKNSEYTLHTLIPYINDTMDNNSTNSKDQSNSIIKYINKTNDDSIRNSENPTPYPIIHHINKTGDKRSMNLEHLPPIIHHINGTNDKSLKNLEYSTIQSIIPHSNETNYSNSINSIFSPQPILHHINEKNNKIFRNSYNHNLPNQTFHEMNELNDESSMNLKYNTSNWTNPHKINETNNNNKNNKNDHGHGNTTNYKHLNNHKNSMNNNLTNMIHMGRGLKSISFESTLPMPDETINTKINNKHTPKYTRKVHLMKWHDDQTKQNNYLRAKHKNITINKI